MIVTARGDVRRAAPSPDWKECRTASSQVVWSKACRRKALAGCSRVEGTQRERRAFLAEDADRCSRKGPFNRT